MCTGRVSTSSTGSAALLSPTSSRQFSSWRAQASGAQKFEIADGLTSTLYAAAFALSERARTGSGCRSTPDVIDELRASFRTLQPELEDYVFTVEVEQRVSQVRARAATKERGGAGERPGSPAHGAACLQARGSPRALAPSAAARLCKRMGSSSTSSPMRPLGPPRRDMRKRRLV